MQILDLDHWIRSISLHIGRASPPAATVFLRLLSLALNESLIPGAEEVGARKGHDIGWRNSSTRWTLDGITRPFLFISSAVTL